MQKLNIKATENDDSVYLSFYRFSLSASSVCSCGEKQSSWFISTFRTLGSVCPLGWKLFCSFPWVNTRKPLVNTCNNPRNKHGCCMCSKLTAAPCGYAQQRNWWRKKISLQHTKATLGNQLPAFQTGVRSCYLALAAIARGAETWCD